MKDANVYILIVVAAFLFDALVNAHKAATATRRHPERSLFFAIAAEMFLGISGIVVLLTSAA
jgi:hypothetical protein